MPVPAALLAIRVRSFTLLWWTSLAWLVLFPFFLLPSQAEGRAYLLWLREVCLWPSFLAGVIWLGSQQSWLHRLVAIVAVLSLGWILLLHEGGLLTWYGASLLVGGIGVGAIWPYLWCKLCRSWWVTWCFAAMLPALVGLMLWMALEDAFALWRLVPTDWELSKELRFQEGIRLGQGRSRFWFQAAIPAAAFLWFLASHCLAVAAFGRVPRAAAVLAIACGGVCFLATLFTYSRAGVVLFILSVLLLGWMLAPEEGRRRFVAGLVLAVPVLLTALVLLWPYLWHWPMVRNLAATLDPTELGNRIRLTLIWTGLTHLDTVPWRGFGAEGLVDMGLSREALQTENTFLNLFFTLGWWGAFLSVGLAVGLLAGLLVTLRRTTGQKTMLADRILLLTLPPYFLYMNLASVVNERERVLILVCLIGWLLFRSLEGKTPKNNLKPDPNLRV